MEVAKVVRASLIDFSLDNKNKEMFNRLSSDDWEKYIWGVGVDRDPFIDQLELFEDMFGDLEGIRDRLSSYKGRSAVGVSRDSGNA